MRRVVPLLMMLAAAPAVAQTPPDAPPPAGRGVLTRAPELVTFVEAVFPETEAGRTGSVVLALTIGVDGRVTDATVTESGGEAFDDAALTAARQFAFTPAEVDGTPSPVRILYRYDFVERAVLPETAIFTGVVRDREAKVPLPRVTVTLADGRTAVTDPEGRFRFEDVPPGPLAITLQGDRLPLVTTEETFVAGEKLEASYDVFLTDPDEPTDDLEILVMAPTLRKQAVSTQVTAEEARKVPGTQGDVLRVVENLPGVARASLGTGALVVWGAAPEDTGVYVDGVRVPRLYHDGGLRSVVGSEFVKSVELVPGGYGASYGRGLGGLVSVTTNRLDERRGVHGAVSADLYDAAAQLQATVGKRVVVGAGGRVSYVGPLLSRFYPSVADFFPIPAYWDAQGRVGVSLGDGEHLDVTVLASSDATTRTAPNPDPAREASETRTLGFQRAYLRYLRDRGDGAATSVVAWGGADQAAQVARFGPVETSIRTTTTLVGTRASHRRKVAKWLALEGGLDAQVEHVDVQRAGSVALPPREGDVRVFGQPPPDQIGSDRFTVVQIGIAPYLEADAALGTDKLHLVAGLRLDPYARSVSRASPQVGISPTNGLFLQDFRAEPRILLRATPSDRTFVTAAVGLYHQSPQATDLSSAFGNPRLPVSQALHAVVSGGGRPVPTLTIEGSAFYTQSHELAMRNPAQQPFRAEALLPLGEGRTYGGQVLVRLDPTKRFYGWISYTLAWAERRNAPDRPWRPSDYDQRHVLTALAGVELPKGFELGVRARVATGYPRTEVVGAAYDNRRDLYQPLFGEQNALRLPTFFQADVRFAKAFQIRATKLDLYLEVQNVTNQANVEELVYDADYGERSGIRGLPVLPVLGLRWSF
jgi:TonB family protein